MAVHIFVKLLFDRRSRARNRGRRLAHSGSILRPRRSRRSQVTRRRTLVSASLPRPTRWKRSTTIVALGNSPVYGSRWHRPRPDQWPRTGRRPGTPRCAQLASRSPQHCCGPSRCPSRPWLPCQVDETGVPRVDCAPTARSPRSAPTGACRGGSHRCRAPGWVPARPAAPRRGDERTMRGRPRYGVSRGDLTD
jgi:hypothetical protein